LAIPRIEIDQVHQPEIAAERFVAADSFVVGEKISAAIEDEPAFEDFDRLYVVRGVAMNNRNTLVD